MSAQAPSAVVLVRALKYVPNPATAADNAFPSYARRIEWSMAPTTVAEGFSTILSARPLADAVRPVAKSTSINPAAASADAGASGFLLKDAAGAVLGSAVSAWLVERAGFGFELGPGHALLSPKGSPHVRCP